jgi:hypothetical protein
MPSRNTTDLVDPRLHTTEPHNCVLTVPLVPAKFVPRILFQWKKSPKIPYWSAKKATSSYIQWGYTGNLMFTMNIIEEISGVWRPNDLRPRKPRLRYTVQLNAKKRALYIISLSLHVQKVRFYTGNLCRPTSVSIAESIHQWIPAVHPSVACAQTSWQNAPPTTIL